MLAAAPSFPLSPTRGTSTPRNILGVTGMRNRRRERTRREEAAVGNKAHTCWRRIPRRRQRRERVRMHLPSRDSSQRWPEAGDTLAFCSSLIILYLSFFFFRGRRQRSVPKLVPQQGHRETERLTANISHKAQPGMLLSADGPSPYQLQAAESDQRTSPIASPHGFPAGASDFRHRGLSSPSSSSSPAEHQGGTSTMSRSPASGQPRDFLHSSPGASRILPG